MFFAKFCCKFLAFLHKKCWKWLFWPSFGVRSTQTLVKIYNNLFLGAACTPKLIEITYLDNEEHWIWLTLICHFRIVVSNFAKVKSTFPVSDSEAPISMYTEKETITRSSFSMWPRINRVYKVIKLLYLSGINKMEGILTKNN